MPERILIIKPSSLGDIIHSLPVLNSLKKCFPHSRIHWVVARNFAELLEDHPMIDRLWIIDKDRWKEPLSFFSNLKELLRLRRGLRAEKFDMVIDLQGLLRSGIIAALTGSALRIGFKEAREGSTLFYTHQIEGGRTLHAVERYLNVLPFTGCSVKEIDFPLPERVLSPEFRDLCKEDYAVIAPGARWTTKRWPPERFGEIAKRLPFKTLIIGSLAEADLATEVVRSSNGKALSLAGKTNLKDLVEIIRNSRLLLSNDSGPVHIGAALGIPTFAIFGPTSPLRTGPYGKNTFVIRSEIDCAPCFKRRCRRRYCMEVISVDNVWKVISDYLNL